MSMIQGIGGVFLYADDAAALAAWYTKHLGMEFRAWGSTFGMKFPSADLTPGPRDAVTAFSIFQADKPLPAGVRTGRVNYRTHDLDALLASLGAHGVEVTQEDGGPYGRFAWCMDPEGNKVELWEPSLKR